MIDHNDLGCARNLALQFVFFLLVIMRGRDLLIFVFLIHAIGQWSLRSFAKTPVAGYLCGLLVSIKSNKVDFAASLPLGRVGLVISCVKLQSLQMYFNLSECGPNQSILASPTMNSSEGVYLDSGSNRFPRALVFAEGGR